MFSPFDTRTRSGLRTIVVLRAGPWGEDPTFEWDEDNIQKFWFHQIRDFEVEECFENEHAIRPHVKARSQPDKFGDRYLVHGRTDGGRRLQIIVQHKGGGLVRPVTGWLDN